MGAREATPTDDPRSCGFATSTSDPCHTPGASRCSSRCFHRLGAVRCAPQEVPSRGGRQLRWSSLVNRLDFNRLFTNLSGSKYLIANFAGFTLICTQPPLPLPILLQVYNR